MTEEVKDMRQWAALFYSEGKRMDGMVGQYMTEHKAENGASVLIADSGLFSAYGGDGALVRSGSGLNAFCLLLGIHNREKRPIRLEAQ